MVIDGDGKTLLGFFLADYVIGKNVVDLFGLGKVLYIEADGSRELLVDDLVAEIYALIADVYTRPGDQLLDLPLTLPAEAAEKLFRSA
jgi:hypothetical protein